MLMPTVGSESGRVCPAVPAGAGASAPLLTWPILLLRASTSCDWFDVLSIFDLFLLVKAWPLWDHSHSSHSR
jgi:hypothetical protein